MESLQEEEKQHEHLHQEEEKDEKEENFKSQMEVYLPTQESLHHIVHERESLWRELDAQKETERVLYSEILELEKRNQESQQELREVRRERDSLLEEKREMERRIDTMMEESASIVSSLIVVQTDLEERMERKVRDARMLSERALMMLKNAGRTMGVSSGDVKEEIVECEVSGNDGEEMVKKFAVGFEAIEQDFKSRVEKMEEMKRKVEFLEGCVEEEMKKKRCL